MEAPAPTVPAVPVPEEDTRDQDIFVEEFNSYFTAPASFDDIDHFSDDSAPVFAYAPWFVRRVLESEEHREILN